MTLTGGNIEICIKGDTIEPYQITGSSTITNT